METEAPLQRGKRSYVRVWLAPALLKAGVKLFHRPSGLEVAPNLEQHAFTASRRALRPWLSV